MAWHIAIDCRHVKDFGVGTYIKNLTRALAKVDPENRYTLIAYPSDQDEFANLGANFQVVNYSLSDSAWRDQLEFPLFVRRLGADLVHIPLHQVPLLLPKPYIVTVHDLSALFYECPEGWRGHWRLYRLRRGVMRAECVICVSRATARDVHNLLGVSPGRLRVIYNAPDPRFLWPERGQEGDKERQLIEHTLGRYQVHYPFLLYVGSVRPQKNVPRLVEAFAVVRSELAAHPKYRDLRLIIIGDEISKYPQLRLAMMRMRVEDAVRFLGFVPIDTLRVFYRAAEAFVFPSLYEGFGLPPLEAMAAGTPVVTANSSSIPEVVGDAAVLVNPENVFEIARGIRDVLLDPELRSQLIARGYRQLRRFNWEAAARQVLETYQVVLQRCRPGGQLPAEAA